MRGYRYFLVILALLISVSMRGQYNPTNPAEPGAYYTLALQATPSGSGSFNVSTTTNCSEGTNVSLRAYANSNFQFVAWEKDGEVISTSSSFTYTMPAKNVKLIVAKTEHSHPLGMVVSTHFRCGKGVKRGLKNGALPFNID